MKQKTALWNSSRNCRLKAGSPFSTAPKWAANGPTHSLKRARVDELKLRHANNSVNRQIDQAYRLFNDVDQDVEHTAEPLPRFLYVFSDRTTACWDAGASQNQRPPDGVGTAFVDVGVKGPEDMAILKVEAEPPVVAAGNSVYIKVTVRAHGKAQKNTVVAPSNNEATAGRRSVQAGTQKIAFGGGRPRQEAAGFIGRTQARLRPCRDMATPALQRPAGVTVKGPAFGGRRFTAVGWSKRFASTNISG